MPGHEDENIKIEWNRVDMELKGASIKKENITTEGKSNDFSQYFLSHCPEGITDVRTYRKITIADIYPGIDWVFYNSSEKGFKYDFIVHPGADPRQIEFIYIAKNPLQLDKQGNLQIKAELGNITENAPESFLDDKLIDSRFKILSTEKNKYNGYDTYIQFSFHDSKLQTPNSTLTIDPALFWATFYGGNYGESLHSVAVDATGNVFVTGDTQSIDFPTQNSGTFFQGNITGNTNVFILKFNNTGSLLWATYYGGTKWGDYSSSITTDYLGNVFVTGVAQSTDFPTQNAGTFFQGVSGANPDVFILKFDNAGNRLWATYYGGFEYERGFSIATDTYGNVFIAGITYSNDFPTQDAGTFFQGAKATGGHSSFILKFDNAGNRLWATYYGGKEIGMIFDPHPSIAIDVAGNVFVTGETYSTDFPVQDAGTFFQGTNAGFADAFILKFDNAGNRLWATYYGGSNFDGRNSIATDAYGNVFVAGTTVSTDFPVQNAGTFFQGTHGGGDDDAFIIKFDNAGNRLWATYYGNSEDDYMCTSDGDNLAIDNCGNVYLSFTTSSPDITTKVSCDGEYFDNTFGGAVDQFIILFSNTGGVLWATYLGGNSNDYSSPLAVDANNNLFVSGVWGYNRSINIATYPLTNPGGGAYYDGTPKLTAHADGFMAKFVHVPMTLNTTSTTSNGGCTCSATVTTEGGCSGTYTYKWNTTPEQTTQTAVNLCSGTYTVTVSDELCNTNTAVVIVKCGSCNLVINYTKSDETCSYSDDGSIALTVSGGTPDYTYNWSTGQTTEDISGLNAGTYTVTVTDSTNCAKDTTMSITEPPAVTADVGSDTIICNGSSTNLTATGGINYSWSTGDTVDIITISPIITTSYTVTVTDVNGCTDIDDVSVTIISSPIPPDISEATICLNETNTATLNIINPNDSLTYYWYDSLTGGTLLHTGNAYTVNNINSAQTYYVESTTVGGCISANRTIVKINIGLEPVADFSANDTAILENETVQFTNLSTGDISWYWTFGENEGTSFVKDPEYIYRNVGIYTVTL
ncbi:MAG: SBBP repeat-containing protein, partial [Bacteroidota bacterium]